MKEETGPGNEAFKMLTHVFKLFMTTFSVVDDVFNLIMLCVLVNYRGRISFHSDYRLKRAENFCHRLSE